MTRFTIRAAILALFAAVAIASTASAADNQGGANKSCPLQVQPGLWYEYHEGSKITVKSPNGSTETFVCRDGSWVQTRTGGIPSRVGTITLSAGSAVLAVEPSRRLGTVALPVGSVIRPT